MGNEYAGGVHVVAATKDGKTEYWAATTLRVDAIVAVRHVIGPGWTLALTERRLTPEQIAALKMHPNSVCQLKGAS
jgi:hypothetical protein